MKLLLMGLGLIVIRKKEDLIVGLRAIIHVLNQISHLREAIIHALNQISHLREAKWKDLILIRMKREKIL